MLRVRQGAASYLFHKIILEMKVGKRVILVHLYFGPILAPSRLYLTEARSNNQHVLILESLLVVTILQVSQTHSKYFECPFDIFLKRIEQWRDYFWREISHSLIQQNPCALLQIAIELLSQLGRTVLAKNRKDRLKCRVVLE